MRANGDDRTAIAVRNFWLSVKNVKFMMARGPSFSRQSSFMSDYDLRPGGSLKLKGGVAEGGIVKK